MAAAKFPGTYKFESSENFEKYMEVLGVGMAMRKMGNMAKPTVTVKLDGKEFYLKSESTFKNIETKCTIGVDFDEETADGRKCKSKMEWNGDKLVHSQSWKGNTTTLTRYIEDNRFVIICEYNGVVCTRKYKRA